MSIQFISAKRTSKNSVEATYKLNDTTFEVEWNNIHPSTGETVRYDLQPSVKCPNEDLKNRIEDAILTGETDENIDIDIYLFIRDRFDSLDAEGLE